MLTYSVLTETPLEQLYNTMILGFSDYQFPMDFPIEKIKTILDRRSFDRRVSVGAFDNDTLVGFIFTGSRIINDQPVAYDCFTAVVPDYRNQGIGKQMFKYLMEQLKKYSISTYYLEVLQDNTNAVELYKKTGFTVTREFCCMDCKKEETGEIKPLSDIHVEPLEKIDIYTDYHDRAASWQNAVTGLKEVGDKFNIIYYKPQGKIQTFLILQKESGDIPQLWYDAAIEPETLKHFLHTLFRHTASERLAIINIEKDNQNRINLLKKCGFKQFTEQFEMVYSV